MVFFIILFVISTAGLMCAISAYTRLHASFCPAAALALQILLLYVFALAGGLLIGVYTVCSLGIIGLVAAAFRPEGFKALLHPGVLFFFIYAAVYAVLLANTVPIGFDNYSHWTIIVKELFRTDALPGAETMVSYKNYPPATALYQYFFLKFAGFGESGMLIAFNILSGAMLSCCFVGTKKKRPFDLVMRAVIALSVSFVIPYASQNLLVDSFIGYAALAVTCVALSDFAYTKWGIVLQALLGSVLILVKMSGIFLLIPYLILLLVRRKILPKEKRRFAWVPVLVLAGVFVAAYFSYSLYNRITFPEVHNTFDLSFSSLKHIGEIKSPEFWASFPKNFVKSFLDPELICNLYFYFVTGFWILLLPFLIAKRKRSTRALKGFIFSLATLALYIAGLFITYVFVMNEYDSTQVASFYRYFGTVIIYTTGVLFVNLQLAGGFSSVFSSWKAVASGFVLSCILLTGLTVRALLPGNDWERRYRMRNETFVKNCIIASEVLEDPLPDVPVYVGTEMSGVGDTFALLVQRYAFWTKNVWPVTPSHWEKKADSAFYLVWIMDSRATADILSAEGYPVPEESGIFYIDEEKNITKINDVEFVAEKEITAVSP